MITKAFEVRDRGTFLPVIAVKIDVAIEQEAPRYLLRSVGYAKEPLVLLTRAAADGQPCNYDPYGWGDRTMHVAHLYISEHFDELEDGAVVDVEFVLDEAAAPKLSERLTAI